MTLLPMVLRAQQAASQQCAPVTYLGVSGCDVLPSGECPSQYHKEAVGPSNSQMKAPTRLICVPDQPASQPTASPQPATSPTPNAETYVSLPIEKKLEVFPDGHRKAEYSFYHDKDSREVLQGSYLSWYDNGRRKSSCNYVNGEKQGVCLWWNEQGKQSDSVEYVHGKPRAIAEWEAHDTRAVKTPVFLYPYILIGPGAKLTFVSNYAGINKEFSLSEIGKAIASLPTSVWVDGRSIGLQQPGTATEHDHRAVTQVVEKLKSLLTKKGYRVYELPS